jgi:hypothetical protein
MIAKPDMQPVHGNLDGGFIMDGMILNDEFRKNLAAALRQMDKGCPASGGSDRGRSC